MGILDFNPVEIQLERLRVGIATSVGPQVAADASLTQLRDMMFDRMVYQLETRLLAERLGSHSETASTTVPRSWWDHWKVEHPRVVRWWSRWVWRLEPDRERLLELTATWTDYASFPKNTYMVPDKKLGPVVFMREGRHDSIRYADE